MSLAIAPEDPREADGRALLAAMNVFAAETYPEFEIGHLWAPEDIARDAAVFLIARKDGAALGCGALFMPEPGVGRINRMFVTEAARGKGVSAALLAALEQEAARRGATMMRLETGFRQIPALTLYRTRGYIQRDSFPPYTDDGLRLFFEKILSPQ